MAPKSAEKKPSTGGKAPAGKAPAEKKEAGKKTAAAASGEKKKRGKTRKETYSSYIYKGGWFLKFCWFIDAMLTSPQSSSRSTLTLVSLPVLCLS